MHNISMTQALEVWSELWQAYYGKNGFGGHAAEIYAYRMQPRNPSAESSAFVAERGRFGLQAAASLYALLDKFATDANCSIEVDGKEFGSWVKEEPFVHRVRVTVTPL